MLIYRYWTGATRSVRILKLLWDQVPFAPSCLETGNAKGSYISHYFTTFPPHIIGCSEQSSCSSWLLGSAAMIFHTFLQTQLRYHIFEHLGSSNLSNPNSTCLTNCCSAHLASTLLRCVCAAGHVTRPPQASFQDWLKMHPDPSLLLKIMHNINPPEQTAPVCVRDSFRVLPGRH